MSAFKRPGEEQQRTFVIPKKPRPYSPPPRDHHQQQQQKQQPHHSQTSDGRKRDAHKLDTTKTNVWTGSLKFESQAVESVDLYSPFRDSVKPAGFSNAIHPKLLMHNGDVAKYAPVAELLKKREALLRRHKVLLCLPTAGAEQSSSSSSAAAQEAAYLPLEASYFFLVNTFSPLFARLHDALKGKDLVALEALPNDSLLLLMPEGGKLATQLGLPPFEVPTFHCVFLALRSDVPTDVGTFRQSLITIDQIGARPRQREVLDGAEESLQAVLERYQKESGLPVKKAPVVDSLLTPTSLPPRATPPTAYIPTPGAYAPQQKAQQQQQQPFHVFQKNAFNAQASATAPPGSSFDALLQPPPPPPPPLQPTQKDKTATPKGILVGGALAAQSGATAARQGAQERHREKNQSLYKQAMERVRNVGKQTATATAASNVDFTPPLATPSSTSPIPPLLATSTGGDVLPKGASANDPRLQQKFTSLSTSTPLTGRASPLPPANVNNNNNDDANRTSFGPKAVPELPLGAAALDPRLKGRVLMGQPKVNLGFRAGYGMASAASAQERAKETPTTLGSNSSSGLASTVPSAQASVSTDNVLDVTLNESVPMEIDEEEQPVEEANKVEEQRRQQPYSPSQSMYDEYEEEEDKEEGGEQPMEIEPSGEEKAAKMPKKDANKEEKPASAHEPEKPRGSSTTIAAGTEAFTFVRSFGSKTVTSPTSQKEAADEASKAAAHASGFGFDFFDLFNSTNGGAKAGNGAHKNAAGSPGKAPTALAQVKTESSNVLDEFLQLKRRNSNGDAPPSSSAAADEDRDFRQMWSDGDKQAKKEPQTEGGTTEKTEMTKMTAAAGVAMRSSTSTDSPNSPLPQTSIRPFIEALVRQPPPRLPQQKSPPPSLLAFTVPPPPSLGAMGFAPPLASTFQQQQRHDGRSMSLSAKPVHHVRPLMATAVSTGCIPPLLSANSGEPPSTVRAPPAKFLLHRLDIPPPNLFVPPPTPLLEAPIRDPRVLKLYACGGSVVLLDPDMLINFRINQTILRNILITARRYQATVKLHACITTQMQDSGGRAAEYVALLDEYQRYGTLERMAPHACDQEPRTVHKLVLCGKMALKEAKERPRSGGETAASPPRVVFLSVCLLANAEHLANFRQCELEVMGPDQFIEEFN